MTRFWNKANTSNPDSCWDWKGYVDQGGYGRFCYMGKSTTASVMAWIFSFGQFRPGLWVLHKCDNRKCINPSHLYLGTAKDNMRDAVERKRLKSTAWDNNPRSKVTKEQAIEIKRRGKSEHRKDLAVEFGLSPVAVSYICNGRNWKGLTT